jgi:formylmethanofuran dehydrogenase subunit E
MKMDEIMCRVQTSSSSRNGRLKRALVSLAVVATLLSGCASAPHAAHETADWYYPDWMAHAPYAPTFQVLDTESSLGPYASRTKTITLKDLVKMHGHPCDGLVTAACAVSMGLRELYPDGVIDRTDTGGICNNSPCYGDVVAYLTGGRVRFGTQKIDPALGNEFILYRFSTHQAVKVTLKPDVFPVAVSRLETRIRSGDVSVADMRRCQQMEWDYARNLLQHPLAESFTVTPLANFKWQPDAYEHLGTRGDIINKNALEHSTAQ